ncbi:MAG TPA: Asp-tRNA(Asn)/Glu-tRNA(Gln) amidotransferase subunit GatC [Chitinophagaceae bacterium]
MSEYPIMEVNDALLDKLSDLARLYIEPTEREGLKQDLQRMITFVEKLQELDTGDTGPLLHMTDTADVLREDVVEGSVSRKEAMMNAPDSDGEFFRVPRVIKKDKPEM